MSCNCEGKNYNISFGCCQPVLGPVENYYTKWEVDELIESATTSGCCITPEEVDEKIEEAISGISFSGVTEEELNNAIASAKTEIEAEIPTVPTSNTAFTNDAGYLTEHQSLSGYATEQWVLDKNYITGVDLSNYATKDEIPTVPTKVSAFENDVPYLTEHQSLSGYVTDAQMSAYTYDKQTIDDKIAQGGTFDPSQYYNTAQTNNLIESAVTRVEAEIPTVPTSNTAFTNDAGYLTEHQSLSGYATEQWVLDKHYITGVDLSDYTTKEYVSGFTYDKATIDEKVASGGTFDPTQYYNKTQTNELVESAVTRVEAEIPTVPTSNTAFTNDAGYLTEHQSLSGYATEQWVLDKNYITGVDLSNYDTKAEVNSKISEATSSKAETTALTAHTANTNIHVTTAEKNTWNNKQNQLTAGTGIDITNNVISATGGGSTYTAGRGIDIDFSNVISFDLPVWSGTPTETWMKNGLALCYEDNVSSGDYSFAEGFRTSATSDASHAEGQTSIASGAGSHAEGMNTTAVWFGSHAEGNGTIASGYTGAHAEGENTIAGGIASHAEGSGTIASGGYSHAEGSNTVANNQSEHASGQYNISLFGSYEFGDSGNTLFSVGNGTSAFDRHNAFEIRQNGDIYIQSGNTDINLQNSLNSKADSSTLNNYLLKSKIWCGTESEYNSIVNKDSETLYLIHE